MPPVRWKFWFYVAAIFAQVALAAQQMQEAISMSSDGWRPIVGIRRQPEQENAQMSSTHRVYDTETTLSPYNQKSHTPYHKPIVYKESGRKPSLGIKPKHQGQKGASPYFVPSGPAQVSYKKPQVKKPVLVQGKPKKPIRGQMVAHSTRNEVFVPPPPPGHTGGAYSYVHTLPQSNLKTREAQGFAFANNFGITQQAAHLELARFPISGSDNILQRPTFFVAKPPQNDEFTRNLVPPPPRSRNPQKNNKDTKISLYAFKEGPATDASSHVPQFGARPIQYIQQVSPTFEYSSQQQKPQKLKEQAVDVQVTKENVKQYSQNVAPAAFGIVPKRNSFPIGYVDYDFQNVRPSSAPSTLTYEVTEGKWLDTPSQQYQFRPQDAFFQYQNVRQPSANARPGLLFQSTSGPPVFQAPIVDINVPTFLPTPYKPENAVLPTSPTQNEAATVFSKVSNKMNKYRTSALKETPLFFDIKEVSTHYPILGIPEAQSEGNTEVPLPMQENGEISNEISTTHKEVKDYRTRRPVGKLPPPTQPTEATSTRDPTRARITNRRRPRPNRPLSTTTTTTEEPVAVEAYESMKSQEVMEEERPRRRRPRPPVQQEEDSRMSEEEDIGRQRGRYSLRNRERTTERIETRTAQRKRLRPGYERFEEPTEPSSEQQYSMYSQESEEPQRIQPVVVPDQPIRQETRPFIEEVKPITTTERVRFLATTEPEQEANTHFHIPENEVDYTTHAQQEVPTTTTTPATTTTSEAPSTTKSTRGRRPVKYDASNRPRFSVKEYRQRLQSTTPSTTTIRSGTESNVRVRFPNRLRTRPTTASSRMDEDVTFDEVTTTTSKSRFRPKEPRHEVTTTESGGIITENAVKAVNTRLRPFGRTRAPAETTTSVPKVSIRPNLFSARRRNGYPSLKERILQKQMRKNETQEMQRQDDSTETVTAEQLPTTTTESFNGVEEAEDETAEEDRSNDISTEITVEESVTEDVIKGDDSALSQRVSDLTSSFKDYDKPGAFNAVAPTSRSIPNHFTLSTDDDPILPIEAFFPSIKEKKERR